MSIYYMKTNMCVGPHAVVATPAAPGRLWLFALAEHYRESRPRGVSLAGGGHIGSRPRWTGKKKERRRKEEDLDHLSFLFPLVFLLARNRHCRRRRFLVGSTKGATQYLLSENARALSRKIATKRGEGSLFVSDLPG